jgi:hypothetical protein
MDEAVVPLQVVLHIAQQVVDDPSPILSFSSRLCQLHEIRLTSKDVSEMMDAMIWPGFIMKHVREEFQTFGGPWSTVIPPEVDVLSCMQDHSIYRLYRVMCVDALATERERIPERDRAEMMEGILRVAERDWLWLPIKRELRARKAAWVRTREAKEEYCLRDEDVRSIPRAGRQDRILLEPVLDRAAERWGTAEALQGHKAKRLRAAEKRQENKGKRRDAMAGLQEALGDCLGKDWSLDQLMAANPSSVAVFKRYTSAPTAKNLAAATGVVAQLSAARAGHVRAVNAWFAGEAQEGADIWRVGGMRRAEQALLSVAAMKLIHACELQCGRADGPTPIMTLAIRHFASRLRAVRMLWTGSPTTPIVWFPTHATWILVPTMQFLDGTLLGCGAHPKERTIRELKALHGVYVDGAALMREYNTRLLPDHVKYISDANMSRALSRSDPAPRTSWDVLASAMAYTHIDLCCAVIAKTSSGCCPHISRHVQEVVASSTCMSREAILRAACVRVLECGSINISGA